MVIQNIQDILNLKEFLYFQVFVLFKFEVDVVPLGLHLVQFLFNFVFTFGPVAYVNNVVVSLWHHYHFRDEEFDVIVLPDFRVYFQFEFLA